MFGGLLHPASSVDPAHIEEREVELHTRLASLRRGGQFMGIWVVTAVLFAVSPLIAHGALSHSSLQAMLPFAGVLAVAAIGQTLVIQQGGLDLSIPGTFSLGVVLITIVPGGKSSGLLAGLLVVVGVGLAAGLLNGLAISKLGITPLVTTLGMNGILVGVEQQVTHGSINYAAPGNWASFTGSKVGGITVLALVALIAVLVFAVLMRRTVWGREFELVGANPRAARAAGLPVARYQIGSYMVAGVFYAVAGALLAGFLGHPQLDSGNDYLLPSIAVVVLGGTALGGGRGSVIATAVGVLFLSQLDQVLTVLGVSTAIQDVIQGAIVALSMGLRNVPFGGWLRFGPGRRSEGSDNGSSQTSMGTEAPVVPTSASPPQPASPR
jgi:ribose transport system permease protein